jgi:hypothetical protein
MNTALIILLMLFALTNLDGATSFAATLNEQNLVKLALNPQPLPPKDARQFYLQRVRPGDKVGLNPQPLPPKTGYRFKNNPADKVELNPQPLPPKQ